MAGFISTNGFTILVQGASHFLGFPVVVDEDVPEGEMRMTLPEDSDNVSGEIELHTPSFMAAPQMEIAIKLKGKVLLTVFFTGDTIADAATRENIATELSRYLESLEPVM